MVTGSDTWQRNKRSIADYMLAIVVTALVVLVSFAFRFSPIGRELPLLLLVAIVVSAQVGGFGPAVAATVLAVLATDYFLFPPFGSFGIESPGDVFELVVICAVSLLAGRQISALRPIKGMSQVMRRVASERDFSHRLGLVRGSDQVGQLAQNIDVLLSSVDDTLRTHREFMAETSHDLRSPLLAMRTNMDLLEYETDPAAMRHCIGEARLQIERMDRLVADVMLLGERETFILANQEPINLSRVVRKVVEEAHRYAGSDRITLRAPGALVVMGNDVRLSQIVSNLVDNALKHTPPGAAVTVILERVEDQARLTVSDEGPGISADHLSHVFRRGYRVHPEMGNGQGLGLAIVQRLTEAHGGRVEAASDPGGGSTFTVLLPIYDNLAPPLAAQSRSREWGE